ncbi:MAG: NADP-dependent oxidoreductase [Sneathiellaceae bacterium]
MSGESNRQWRLARRPVGDIGEQDLDWVTAPAPDAGPGQVRVRTLILSMDPTNRIWMSDAKQYMPPVKVGDVMRGVTVGVVDQSNVAGYAPGDLVNGMWGWQDYAVVDVAKTPLGRLPAERTMPLPGYVALVGGVGMTAYFGLLDIGRPQPGETLVVSAAAGAVGSLVGQIGKIKGCKVIGIAGSAEKCRWITEELGFDAAIDYRAQDVGAELDRLAPEGIDIDFENVGGPVMGAIFARLRLNARVPLCGLISHYNAEGPVPGPANFEQVLMQRATVKGFIVLDYAARFPEAMHDLIAWHAAGRIKYQTDIVQGLENAAATVKKLFEGGNTGKLMVQVAELPD